MHQVGAETQPAPCAHQAAVVVPVYKQMLNPYEQIALERCLRIFRQYTIILIAPEGLCLDNYLGIDQLDVQRFDPGFFENIQGYNRLMLSQSFYERFLQYQYILIYQLDAFVFSDQLASWCSQGYAYVGAPWPDIPRYRFVWSRIKSPVSFVSLSFRRKLENSVGNGGFSLRNVEASLQALRKHNKRARTWEFNEDFFWAFYVAGHSLSFQIPSFKVALQFSFELAPARCFMLNNYQLPFGCHAWEKYDIGFWRPIFRGLGYSI